MLERDGIRIEVAYYASDDTGSGSESEERGEVAGLRSDRLALLPVRELPAERLLGDMSVNDAVKNTRSA